MLNFSHKLKKEIAFRLNWALEVHEVKPSNAKLWSANSLSMYCPASNVMRFIKLFCLEKFDQLALIALISYDT